MDNALIPDARLRLYTLGGLIIALISLVVLHAGYYFGDHGMDGIDSFFLVNYLLAGGYLVAGFGRNIKNHDFGKFWKFEPEVYRITVILFAIAAFSLNRSMEVLGDTPFWLGAYLYLAFLSLFLDIFSNRLPPVWNAINAFFSGMGLVICVYFTLLVMPLLPVSVLGLVVFGISSVAFTPLFAVGGFFKVLRRRNEKYERISAAAGVVLPILFLFAFMAQYGVVRKDMEAVLKDRRESNSDLPEPIFAAQYLPERAFSRQLMQVNDDKLLWEDRFLDFDSREGEFNDPLTVLGHGLSREMPIRKLQRQQILATQTDLRHQSQRRLWEDDHLLTRHITTEIEIYPEYRLAYTEKIFEIEHYGQESHNQRWQEEAVYTFHLPEGSVATSLSLWVDGKERKARFSSKKKADNAYATIVGRESRDPALLHWQEGNTLTVTVFPVQPDLPRKFKLGVTSPLRAQDGQLKLESIYFEGPTNQFTKEKGHLRIIGDETPAEIDVPGYFDKDNKHEYSWEGSYEPYWEFKCQAGPISSQPFVFNGFSYRAFPNPIEMTSYPFKRVYLDLNAAWSDVEFEEVWQQVKSHEVWTFDRKMKRITDENRLDVLASAQEARFSIFPFYQIEDPATALVVSHSAPNYVTRADLEASRYNEKMSDFLQAYRGKIAFYNIGGAMGPYLRTFKEFGVLNYACGEPVLLGKMLTQNAFFQPQSDSGTVVLADAGMLIEQSDAESGAVKSKAPDHLLRLFAYNKCLEEAGRNFLLDSEFSEKAMLRAEEAYVVSPFTSLIVLETEADYQRFGIDESENSLGNAGLSGISGKGTGSIPEPHEWLLIGLVLLLLIYTQRRRFRFA
jgi:XrtN system VIT domain protein